MGDQPSVGIRRSSEETVREASGYAAFLAAIASGAPDEDVARLAASWAQHLLEADGASVTQVEGNEAIYIAAVGEFEQVAGRRLRLLESFTGKVIRNKRPQIFVPDNNPLSRTRAQLDSIRSGLVAPVMLDERVLGTLGVASKRPHAFGEADLGILSTLADALAVGLALGRQQQVHAIVIADLEEENRRQLDLLTAVSQRMAGPLGAIGRMSGALLSSRLDEQQRELLRGIRSSAEALLALIQEAEATHGPPSDTEPNS